MKILITGGLGNLGIWFTKYFLDNNNDVTVISRTEKIKIDHPNYRFLSVDITQKQMLLDAIDCYYDICIHCSSYNEHFHDEYTSKALSINALGTEYLCQSLLVNGVGRLIYLSTFHVYGLNEGVITESLPVNPISDYGLTHFFAEKYIEKHARINNLKYTTCRLTNSYGCPKDLNTDKWYLVLNNLCQQAIKYKKIELTSNGKALRDFIWMGDVVRVIDKIIDNNACTNKVINLSSNSTFSIFDVAEYVQDSYFKIFNIKLPVIINNNDIKEPKYLEVSNKMLTDMIPYTFTNHFENESMRILEFLRK